VALPRLDLGDRHLAAALGLELVALWPAWVWYVDRLADAANEPWGVLALVTAFLLPARRTRAAREGTARLGIPTLLLVLFALAYPFVPSLLATLFAMTTVGVTYALWRHGTPWPSPRWGLVLLSVPMMTSIHFYLGFPLRVVTAATASLLLQLAGWNVVREGVCLRLGANLILVDTPCSGVRMLWAGTFLVLALASRRGLGPGRAVLAAAASVFIGLFGNALRTVALFFPQAGLVTLPDVFHPDVFHSAVGVAVFIAVAVAIAWCCPRPRMALEH
jgi:exosortase/archaeosortase family protein